jgi:hypothetical protein
MYMEVEMNRMGGNLKSFILLGLLVLIPIQWSCSSSNSNPTTNNNTGSGTIPSAVLMPAAAPVPVSSVPGSGLWVVGAVVGDETISSGTTFLLGLSLVTLSVNNHVETTDHVVITPPSASAPVTLTYTQSITYSGYAFSQYAGSVTYVPGGNYSMAVSTSLGTANSSLASMPGGVVFYNNGGAVSAVYPGTYNAGVVEETNPTFALTYQSTSSISDPFSFPSSAYGSSPATYSSTYCTAGLNTTFSGTASATGVFVGSGLTVQTFTRP